MKSIGVFLAVGFVSFLPLLAFADNWLPGRPILPQEVIDNAPNRIQACDLVHTVDHLLDFGIYLAAMVATIMFVYAGFLYVTASARQENISQAKNIFGKVFMGFVIILIAWLIVSIILHVFTDRDLAFWSDIDCPPIPLTQQEIQTGRGEVQVAVMNNDLETANRRRLALLGVGVNNENACQPGETRNCTSTEGISAGAIIYAGDVKEDCGRTCEVTITGGSEGGHAGDVPGTPQVEGGPGTHGAGDKIDFRTSPGLTRWVGEQEESGRFVRRDNPAFGEEQWVDTRTGAVWTRESDPPHFDVCVSNCGS